MSDPSRPVFNDRYEIQSRIGRGGMADVFRAHDRLLDRPVAIKVLFPEFATDPNFVARFRREAQAAANLTHANIVGVFDWGQQGSTYFIVMEYVTGKSLAEVLRAGGPLPAARAADVAAEVAGALGFAHRNNVVHRDVKPANILMSESGQVKVADFGIARALNSPMEQDLTQAGAVMGTATYFSPEQAQGAQPDPRSDLYSLGIVLYELVTGRPPFSGDNPVSIAYKQVHEMPIRPSQVNPNVPSGLEAIIHRLLQKDPAKRYQTAEELRIDLRRFRETGTNDQVAAARAMPVSDLTATVPRSAAPSAGDTATAMSRAQSAPITQAVPQTRVTPAQASVRAGGPPPSLPPRRTGLIVAAVIATIAVVAALLFAVYQFVGSSDPGTPATPIVVANVVNLPVEQATAALESQGLTHKVTPVQSDTITAGLVISQLPAAGAKADQGAQVELTVSSGPQLVKVDSFVGVVATEAKTTLEKLGFTVTINQQVSDQPVGNVIAQTPPAGQVAPKSNIALTVSAGPDQAIIPNVIGFDAVDAGVALAKLSVNVVKATEASATVAVNKVIRTEPAAGTPVPKNTDVKLVVSSGPAPIVVPSVVDMTQSDAVDAIQKVNLKVRLVTIASDTAHIGKVVSQDPAGNGTNTLAQPDGTVVLNVGRGPDTTTTSPPPPSTVAPPTTVASTTTAAAP